MKGIQELNPLGYLDPYKLIYIVKIKNIYAQKIQGGKNLHPSPRQRKQLNNQQQNSLHHFLFSQITYWASFCKHIRCKTTALFG